MESLVMTVVLGIMLFIFGNIFLATEPVVFHLTATGKSWGEQTSHEKKSLVAYEVSRYITCAVLILMLAIGWGIA